MSKEFKHPGMFMGHFRRLTYQIWNTGKYASSWERNRYKEVNEVVFTLYYPGKDFGTETPIAKFGLSRSVGESVKWRGISSKDGTFQDLMKEKGTYWLHPQVPDMGTPTALIKRQTP